MQAQQSLTEDVKQHTNNSWDRAENAAAAAGPADWKYFPCCSLQEAIFTWNAVGLLFVQYKLNRFTGDGPFAQTETLRRDKKAEPV